MLGAATGGLLAAVLVSPDRWRSIETVITEGWIASAAAQEAPEEDDDAEDNDEGGDGVGAEDVGNDGVDDVAGDDTAGAGDDAAGDDGAASGDDGAAGGDDGAAGGDDGAAGGDDGATGGDDGGAGGDDGGEDGGFGGDDGATGGDDGPGIAPGGDEPGDDDGAGGEGGTGDDEPPGAGGGAAGGGRSSRSDDDDAPGGAGVRGLSGDSGSSVRDGDRDVAGPSSLPDGVEVDFEGRWVRGGEILALEADPTSLELARGLGFLVIERHRLTTLGLSIVELRVPRGQSTRGALESVRVADPDTAYDFNHIYLPVRAAAMEPAVSESRTASAALTSGAVGIIDTGVDTTHPALRASRILQADFSGPGERRPTTSGGHGTAVASILVGGQNEARGGRVFAANVIARSADRRSELASADAIVRALDWLARNDAPVANISLAGPPNSLVEDAVRRAQARGMIIVAAVGNDGPAAPPLYPSAYDGVVGVTAVDSAGVVYRRAGRGAHVDIAARGVAVTVAAPGGQSVQASGTSFAAPVVAAALAQRHVRPDPASARSAIDRLMAGASDAGPRGRDPVYGVGVLTQETQR